jgi:AcrR family transcriptional regulator
MVTFTGQDGSVAETRSGSGGRRTGRRPGESGTREAILDAARRLFAERGYEEATLRGVAREAGVDPALIVHFFRSKPGLFVAAIGWPFDPERAVPALVRGPRDEAGTRLARLFVRTWDRAGDRDAILSLVRAATGHGPAATLLGQFLRHALLEPLVSGLDADRPAARASLVASQLVGLGLARYVLVLEPLASARPGSVVEAVAPTLQRYLTGEIGSWGRRPPGARPVRLAPDRRGRL